MSIITHELIMEPLDTMLEVVGPANNDYYDSQHNNRFWSSTKSAAPVGLTKGLILLAMIGLMLLVQ